MRINTKSKIWLSQAANVIPSDKPIIFWDTCALLDILRIPCTERTNLNFNTLQSYEWIEVKIREHRITSVTSDVVVREFSEHVDNLLNLLAEQEQKTKDEVKEQSLFMSNTTLASAIVRKVNLLEVQKRVLKLVKSIFNQTIILKSQQSFARNADYRVRNYIKPSGGKESYKDSYLWISYIALMRKIGPTELTFFFTTNPSDFAEHKKSDKLHPNLASELPFPNCRCSLNMSILKGLMTQYFTQHP